MKTVKEILEAYEHSLVKGDDVQGTSYLSKVDTRRPAKFPDEKSIPNVLTLVRKAIRVFPDNQKIALYYSQALDKYVSIPYGPNNKAMGIHLSEKAPTFNPDVEPELQDYYNKEINPKRRPIKRDEILGAMKTPEAVRFKGGTKARLKKIVKSNMSGTAKAGQIIGTLARKAMHQAGFVKEEASVADRFKSNLKHIREENLNEAPYGKADAALDAASFIPGPAGSIASLASAGRSLGRGDYVGAALDAAGALPGVGYIAKGAKVAKVAKGSKVLGAAAKTLKRGGGIKKAISSANKQRKALNAAKKAKAAKAAKAAKGGKMGKLGALGAGVGLGAALGGGDSGNSGSGDGQSAWDAAKAAVPKSDSGDFSPAGRASYRSGQDSSSAALDWQRQNTRKFSATKTPVQENFDIIKTIAESKQSDVVSFGDTSITINNRIAKKIVSLHESLNKDNKQKLEKMLSEDANSFRKIINFALRH